MLGGGLVPASVVLLAGEPGIGKSTLLLHLLARLSESGRSCLLVSGEESHGQVAARSRRLGIAGDAVAFAPGRDLAAVLGTARARAPFLLAVDSIQAVRDPSAPQMPGGVAQVRTCTDALVGMAKEEGIGVVMTGHVTKDGDVAGPRALEHAVDVVLMFEGDPRSGLRVLSGGKNRFGAEGETAWFEMDADGLHEIDPAGVLLSGNGVPGAAIALPLAGRRALAVEVQALVGSVDGPARRQTTGLDARRFQLMAAVLARAGGTGSGERSSSEPPRAACASTIPRPTWRSPPLSRRPCRASPRRRVPPSSERCRSRGSCARRPRCPNGWLLPRVQDVDGSTPLQVRTHVGIPD